MPQGSVFGSLLSPVCTPFLGAVIQPHGFSCHMTTLKPLCCPALSPKLQIHTSNWLLKNSLRISNKHLTLTCPKLRFWSPSTPNLYHSHPSPTHLRSSLSTHPLTFYLPKQSFWPLCSVILVSLLFILYQVHFWKSGILQAFVLAPSVECSSSREPLPHLLQVSAQISSSRWCLLWPPYLILYSTFLSPSSHFQFLWPYSTFSFHRTYLLIY